MQKILVFSFLIVKCSLGFCQKIIVDYNYSVDAGKKLGNKEFLLIFLENESFYMTNDEYDFTENNTLENFKDKKLTTFIKLKDDVFFELKWKVPKSRGIVEDHLDYNWVISREQKEILGYQCFKATTFFRGRSWTAFFTYEIPTSSGPWKFKGLPGLILQAFDSENIFNFSAEKIFLNSEIILPKLFSDFFENFEKNKNKIINYQQYVKSENDFFEDLQRKGIASQSGLNLRAFDKRYFELEKTFEWEEETKKP